MGFLQYDWKSQRDTPGCTCASRADRLPYREGKMGSPTPPAGCPASPVGQQWASQRSLLVLLRMLRATVLAQAEGSSRPGVKGEKPPKGEVKAGSWSSGAALAAAKPPPYPAPWRAEPAA